jgi:hypothetical protein
MLDAIQGSDDEIAGQRMTRLVDVLEEVETTDIAVESTLGFGETTDGTGAAKFLVGGEIVEATSRIDGPANFKFIGLTRGVDNTKVRLHPVGTLVFDLSENTSALHHARRGLFVDTALGTDLDVVGRNLGLTKCPGLTDAQWRAIIKAVAYLPKQPIDAFERALTALLGAGNFDINESLITDPYTVFVRILVALATSLQGRFLLNSGEPQLTTGVLKVETDYTIIEPALSDTLTELGVLADLTVEGHTLTFPASGTGTETVGVYDDTTLTRRGYRDGFTNYAIGGSISGNSITLGSSPGAAGTPVIVDYTGFSAHYLAENETRRHADDFYAYLADPLLSARCLLEQVRAAGIRVDLSAQL